MGNIIDLQKKSFVVLEKKGLADVLANVVLAMDTSGSMGYTFSNGTVQSSVERLLGLGLNMDFNKSIEVFTFANGAKYIGDATKENIDGYVNNVMLRKTSVNGGTNYAPVMNAIIDKFGKKIEMQNVTVEKKQGFFGKLFGAKPKTETIQQPVVAEGKSKPTVVFFITDGDNFDPQMAEHIIREASTQPIFWQFVGIGRDNFSFLEMLDEMEGRFIDNANFFQLNDINNISDEDLYERLLNELPSWLKEAKEKNILA